MEGGVDEVAFAGVGGGGGRGRGGEGVGEEGFVVDLGGDGE